jgi:hypothetical protein
MNTIKHFIEDKKTTCVKAKNSPPGCYVNILRNADGVATATETVFGNGSSIRLSNLDYKNSLLTNDNAVWEEYEVSEKKLTELEKLEQELKVLNETIESYKSQGAVFVKELPALYTKQMSLNTKIKELVNVK